MSFSMILRRSTRAIAQRSHSSLSPAVSRAPVSHNVVLTARSEDLLNSLAGVPVRENKLMTLNAFEPATFTETVHETLPRITFQDLASARLFFDRTGETLPILEALAV